MNRNDLVLVGCGGCGNKIVDTILNYESRFIGYFINSSKTDIESLDNYDDVAVNYLCISNQQNGMGRDRQLGKRYASKRGMNILEIINNFDQKTIYLVTSFGGGSGSSIVSVLLSGIEQLKKEGLFDKKVNLIGVLPSIDSSKDILKNSLETWNEIMSYDCVNNMIFLDNNNTFDGEYLEEQEINEKFAELFDSIFDIPIANGRNFDNGNLGKIMNSKGCLYIYNLPNGYETTEQAFKQSNLDSILAKMYESNEVYDIDDNGRKRIKCSYIGTSFNDENYKHENILDKYKFEYEDFTGYNEENNLVLISGCFPPLYSIQVIMAELEERQKEEEKTKNVNFKKFVIKTDLSSDSNSKTEEETKKNKETVKTIKNTKSKTKDIKKIMKKDLFDMYK